MCVYLLSLYCLNHTVCLSSVCVCVYIKSIVSLCVYMSAVEYQCIRVSVCTHIQYVWFHTVDTVVIWSESVCLCVCCSVCVCVDFLFFPLP